MSRYEEMLTSIANGDPITEEPICRREKFLQAIANGDASNLPEPICREEELLLHIAENGTGGSGEIVTENITVTPKATQQVVKRSTGKYINQVTVNPVPTEEVTATENNSVVTPTEGKFISKVNVNVPVPDLTTTTATAEDVLEGKEFYNASGEKVAGTYKDMLQARVNANGVCSYLYYYYSGEQAFIDNLDVSKVTKMASMFQNCINLTSLDLSHFDVSKVTTMAYMFDNCNALTTINLSSFDTSRVTRMEHMFFECSSLTSLDLSNFNTSAVTSMENMFWNCKALTTLDISNFDIRNVSRMNGTFCGCEKLETIPGELDLIKGPTNTSMLTSCYNLKNLTLKNITRSLVIGITTWGHLLTLDSLLNAIQELHTNTGTSTKTLSMGTPNIEKLANIYVKLIEITDEMRAEDQYIDNKAPFVQCESTDEGAMLVTEYVTTVKNWKLG